MKKVIFSIAVIGCLNAQLNAATIVLSGTLGNTNLTADNCYKLRGCVIIPNTVVLNIAPGTQIRAEAGSSLIIDRGGSIQAIGTAMLPIVFTSDQAVGNRAPGDWAGLTIIGNAPNNATGGTFTVDRCGTSYTAGGNVSNDNSGTLRYVRIEFAGQAPSPGDGHLAGLTLASVGSGTTMDHVQVSASDKDGYAVFGGTINFKKVISYNNYQNDFRFENGYVGFTQFGLALRPDANAHSATGSLSNGIYIANNVSNPNNTPYTDAKITQYSILGPKACDGDKVVNSNFQYGLQATANAKFTMANSVIAGYRLGEFYLADVSTVANTGNNSLNFRYNALWDNLSPNYSSISWGTGACSGSMQDWMEQLTSVGCEEPGNDVYLSNVDYDASLCGDYCETTPDFSYMGGNLDGTDFSAPFNIGYIDQTATKGALYETDWTLNWSSWCPEQNTYCTFDQLKTSSATNYGMRISPNPSIGTTRVTFDATVSGMATLLVTDKITGNVLRSYKSQVKENTEASFTIDVAGLRTGNYTVHINIGEQNVYGNLLVH